jgi:hypothetical protein
MRNVIGTIVLLALLGSRAADAQTMDRSPAPAGPAEQFPASSLAHNTRFVGGAPIGHRQPHAADVPSASASDLERISSEDAKVDRKLTICRGC